MTNASVTMGIVLSFAVSEITGLLSGGLIGPGYLALYMDQPARVAATLAVAGITYLLVKLLSNYVILFGRRRFMAMVLGGLLVGWLAGRVMACIPQLGQGFGAVGHIVPGLIANDSYRQGFIKTALATLAAAGMVRLALVLIF